MGTLVQFEAWHLLHTACIHIQWLCVTSLTVCQSAGAILVVTIATNYINLAWCLWFVWLPCYNVLYKERHYLQAAKNLLKNQITVDQQQTISCTLSAMATKPIPVYIQDNNSGLVMECQFDKGPYQVVIRNRQQGNLYQQFYITCSGVTGYVYVESVAKPNTVVTAGNVAEKPLYMSPKDTSPLNLNELWILREPNSGNDQCFVLMSAATGLVMDVVGFSHTPGTNIQTYDRNNTDNQQWAFLSTSWTVTAHTHTLTSYTTTYWSSYLAIGIQSAIVCMPLGYFCSTLIQYGHTPKCCLVWIIKILTCVRPFCVCVHVCVCDESVTDAVLCEL